MKRLRVSKLGGYAGVAGFGLLTALTLGLPELAAVTAPFALLAVLGLIVSRDPAVEATLDLSADRAFEEDEIEAGLRIRAPRAVERLEVLVALPDGLTLAEGENVATLRLR